VNWGASKMEVTAAQTEFNMSKLQQVFRLLVSLIREISDESAYERYLRNSGQQHSRETWRRFIDKRHSRKFKNAKCC